MTSPPTPCRATSSRSRAASSRKRPRRMVSSGEAMLRRVSDSASPIVFAPRSSAISRRPPSASSLRSAGLRMAISDASFRGGRRHLHHGVGQGHRGAYRHAGAHQTGRERAGQDRERAQPHPELGRAAPRNRHVRRRADDQRRGDGSANARGRRHRRRPARRHPRQRAGERARLLRCTESRRVTALTDLTMAAARDGLAKKDFSARELAEAHVAAVAAARPLNAFTTETPDQALAMAAESDARLARGAARRLEGLPLAIKDLFCTKGVLTTAASHILDGFKPHYESTVTSQLWQAGAVMLGKTNIDEFAMGSSTSFSYSGPTENPWRRPGDNRPLVPGGSSGGSAAAVAAHAALGATGTDTGGSIRQPASFCGIVGLKPTYGRCSRWGVV